MKTGVQVSTFIFHFTTFVCENGFCADRESKEAASGNNKKKAAAETATKKAATPTETATKRAACAVAAIACAAAVAQTADLCTFLSLTSLEGVAELYLYDLYQIQTCQEKSARTREDINWAKKLQQTTQQRNRYARSGVQVRIVGYFCSSCIELALGRACIVLQERHVRAQGLRLARTCS